MESRRTDEPVRCTAWRQLARQLGPSGGPAAAGVGAAEPGALDEHALGGAEERAVEVVDDAGGGRVQEGGPRRVVALVRPDVPGKFSRPRNVV